MKPAAAQTCPQCGSRDTVKFGTRLLGAMGVAGGRLARTEQSVQRFRCKGCRKAFADSVPDSEVLNLLAESAMRHGISGAAALHGVVPRTVARHLARWIEIREPELSTEIPDVLAMAALPSGRSVRFVLTDPVEEGMLDVVDGLAGLKAHSERCTGMPSLVSIDADPALAKAVKEIWPSAVVAVPVSAAVRAVEAAALTSFRALVRVGVFQGRNYRERPELLRVPDQDLSDIQRDELAGWSAPLRRFRFVVLVLIKDLKEAALDAFATTYARVQASLKEICSGGALDTMLATWRPLILAGVEHRWLDAAYKAVDALRKDFRTTRPVAGLDILRAVLVFSVEPEEVLAPARPGQGDVQRRAGRRPIGASVV